MLALALMAEAGEERGGDETSKSFGGVMVLLATGYILAAIMALTLEELKSRQKVCAFAGAAGGLGRSADEMKKSVYALKQRTKAHPTSMLID